MQQVQKSFQPRTLLKKKFRQAGMTLTESLLVLGVGAAVAVLAYGGYKMAIGQTNASSQVRGITQLVAGIQRVFGVSGNFSTVTAANVVNSRIVPTDLRSVGTSISTVWGGAITPGVGNQAGNTPVTNFKLTIAGVPKDACVDFLSGISGAASTLWVNGTTAGTNDAKDSTGTYHPDRAATQCEAGPGNIILVSG